jgi:hypothetical protein
MQLTAVRHAQVWPKSELATTLDAQLIATRLQSGEGFHTIGPSGLNAHDHVVLAQERKRGKYYRSPDLAAVCVERTLNRNCATSTLAKLTVKSLRGTTGSHAPVAVAMRAQERDGVT